jgi:epoxyqueuosine reductase
MDRVSLAQIIKSKALEAGFDSCGITPARFLEKDAPRLEKWLKNGYHGDMTWMENHFDKRLDPSKLVLGAKSVVCLTFNYFPEEDLFPDQNDVKIAKYAYGQDYHHVLKSKMKKLTQALEQEMGKFNYRYFVDSAPVLERSLAAQAGLGWIGKHSLLLSKKKGSFFFLAVLISDLEPAFDGPVTDHCGSCTACIDACPTEAIVEDKVVDSNKCISYLTIELKKEIPTSFKNNMENWVFGCDICQDVCPWNRFSEPHKEPLFAPNQQLKAMKAEDWEELTQETFSQIFRKSAVKRTKHTGLKRNLEFVKKEF